MSKRAKSLNILQELSGALLANENIWSAKMEYVELLKYFSMYVRLFVTFADRQHSTHTHTPTLTHTYIHISVT